MRDCRTVCRCVRTSLRDVCDIDAFLVRHEAEDREDDKAGVETGRAVDKRHDKRVPETASDVITTANDVDDVEMVTHCITVLVSYMQRHIKVLTSTCSRFHSGTDQVLVGTCSSCC